MRCFQRKRFQTITTQIAIIWCMQVFGANVEQMNFCLLKNIRAFIGQRLKIINLQITQDQAELKRRRFFKISFV
ncbi:hypothetical protein CDAR_536821 [Caerostris darwini]|uniref:Secreted protein n=1 Tax=Caerostris darwini TaxID=1538125 RepID=A0AAV4MTB0_9ARAC|nr:hypothetical protein CDAR_536821 [Caerostris darwini]